MRLGLVVVVVMCGLAACQARNGTYFIVDGEQTGIAFDQLEFFLGKEVGTETPYTPERPLVAFQGQPPVERQRLVKRLFVESDVQTTPASTSLSYYLPHDDAGDLEHYALVVAWRDEQIVGLGEVEAYKVFEDAAYLYDVSLVPVDPGFERWGTPDSVAGACVRWTRARDGDAVDSTYVVAREDDHDCDGVRDKSDCDDLNYCSSTGSDKPCVLRETGCITASCDLGACTDGPPSGEIPRTCTARTCLPEAFCNLNDSCAEAGPTREFLACALDEIGMSHTEVSMPVKSVGGGLCTHEYDVPLPFGLGCLAPQIESPPLGRVPGNWMFVVSSTPSLPGSCRFDLMGPAADAPPPSDTHLLVSVLITTAPPRRTSFVIGFAPYSTSTGNCTESIDLSPPTAGTSKPICP